jgi:alpha-beta hydrolase superfamily lysophospholipase
MRAVIVLAHGLAEHSGRYQTVVKDLTDRHYGIYSLDHIGHGRSEGDRCCVKSFNDLVQPIHNLVLEIKQSHPLLPVFLLGHSMGGLICGNYLLDHQNQVDGAIFSAPAVLGHQQPDLKMVLKLIYYALVSPQKGVLQLDAKGVSRNPAVVAAYVQDPLVYTGKVPACMMLALAKAMRRLQLKANRITAPVLILQGDKDKLVNPEGARLLYDQVSSPDKFLQRYPPSYHEILNELEYPLVLSAITDWVRKHIRDA